MLIEAKGYEYWKNEQLRSKSTRLQSIFGKNGDGIADVTPHFVLLTNRESNRIDTESWPRWMKDPNGKPFWLKYSPTLPQRLKPTRCTSNGVNDEDGGHVRFDCVP